jgi:hypothetical protein
MLRVFLAALMCPAAVGQSQVDATAPSAFEVASIKPSVLPPGYICGQSEGGPGTSDPGRIAYHNQPVYAREACVSRRRSRLRKLRAVGPCVA